MTAKTYQIVVFAAQTSGIIAQMKIVSRPTRYLKMQVAKHADIRPVRFMMMTVSLYADITRKKNRTMLNNSFNVKNVTSL